jgi:hypothetical protein
MATCRGSGKTTNRPASFATTGTDLFHLTTWDEGSRKRLGSLRLPDRCYGADFAPDQGLAAVRGLHCALVYDLHTSELVGQAEVRSGLPLVAFRPGFRQFALADRDAVRLESLDGGAPQTHALPARLVSFCFAPDGSKLHCGLEDSSLHTLVFG